MNRPSARKLTFTILTTAFIFFAGAACDPPEEGLPTMPGESASEQTEGASASPAPEGEAESDQNAGSDDQGASGQKDELPIGEPPSKAPLEKAIEAENERAHAALFDTEKCELDRLQRCLKFERESNWREAGRCYRRTFDGDLMGHCRSMQFIKSAVNYRRAGLKKKELEQWLELVARADSQVAGVLIADLRLAEGRFEFARAAYALYLDQDEHSMLEDYVKAQCERLGGCDIK
jgi:hypothetical protein